jgi:hypothetical protein
LATWQIDPENPHAHTNFIRTPEGKLQLIRLESLLIPFVQPLAMPPRMFRIGRIPTFDDVDYAQLHRYVEEHRADMETRWPRGSGAAGDADRHGGGLHGDLEERGAESLGPCGPPHLHWFDWDRRTELIRRRLAQLEELALRLVMKSLDRWVSDGWITAEETDAARQSMESASARKVLRFLRIHIAQRGAVRQRGVPAHARPASLPPRRHLL